MSRPAPQLKGRGHMNTRVAPALHTLHLVPRGEEAQPVLPDGQARGPNDTPPPPIPYLEQKERVSLTRRRCMRYIFTQSRYDGHLLGDLSGTGTALAVEPSDAARVPDVRASGKSAGDPRARQPSALFTIGRFHDSSAKCVLIRTQVAAGPPSNLCQKTEGLPGSALCNFFTD